MSSSTPRPDDEAVEAGAAGRDFIRDIIDEDNRTGKHGGRVATRFPPEPNGFLHIGHAKSICLNFGLAKEYGGTCNLRFDDTNPLKEDERYVRAIEEDVRWLGFEWDAEFHASDYYPALYDFAVKLIKQGAAYVCSLSDEAIRQYRGTVTEPGTPSPDRDRSVDENLDLLARMRQGEFDDGTYTVRAKIDMANPNMKMRDPPIYRIRHASHHRTGDAWCIYPMYDFTHCLSDSLEAITHSICTLEFENNRELYDWFLDTLEVQYHPQQIEFARLSLAYTVMSKRRLLRLVEDKYVHGWDDPRMPTIAGMRRRGYTPEAIRAFCEKIGVARRDNLVDLAFLEYCVRDDLNPKVPRAMAVLRPLKLIIDNYPEGEGETLTAINFPDDPPRMGERTIPFCRELYIEREDFMEKPSKGYFRLAPGKEVRLRWAYLVTCVSVTKDEHGEVTEVHCTYDPESRGGSPADGRKVKGTIHWVSAAHARPAEVRLYDRLFTVPSPDAEEDFTAVLNPESLQVLEAFVEPSLAEAAPGLRFQFERQGYFIADPDGTKDRPVFNRTVALRDGWAKLAKANVTQG
ncbi:MAG: glutamine--tRNA ligase/YqeY domain fusion protein [Deltaproteobacteria bacterium]|nr:glutamine--tRNA ligase/YqeY domain fusion protein [Deltaproteobacteria bacterium]